MFAYLIYIGPTEDPKKFACLYKYSEVCRGFSMTMREDMIDKGLIIDQNKIGESYPDNYQVTPKFSKHLRLEVADFADLLWEEFPKKVVMGDKLIAARNVGPEELEDLIKTKMKRGRIDNEDEVIRGLRIQKDTNTIAMGLRKWVETEQWKEGNQIEVAEYGEDI